MEKRTALEKQGSREGREGVGGEEGRQGLATIIVGEQK